MVQLFCIFFSKYHKITEIQNGCLKVFAPKKLIRSLADIAEHNYKIKRISDRNFFRKRAYEHFFVSGHRN